MRDTDGSGGGDGGEDDDDIPMTLLAVNGSYWLYEGEDLLNDMLFGRGLYPFRVRCVLFKDVIELRSVLGASFQLGSCWRIVPDIVDRLRRENLLVEVLATDD